MEIHQKWYSKT